MNSAKQYMNSTKQWIHVRLLFTRRKKKKKKKDRKRGRSKTPGNAQAKHSQNHKMLKDGFNILPLFQFLPHIIGSGDHLCDHLFL